MLFHRVHQVDVKLSDAAGKLTRLTLLSELLAKKYGAGAADRTPD